MKIWDFLGELALFYPLKKEGEAREKLFSYYVENLEGICITKKEEYDWRKILMAIQRGYKKRDYPLLADIINFLPEGKIEKQYQACRGEGSLIVITLPTGQKYSFTVCGYGRSKDAIVEEIRTKYGACDISTYPKGSVLIGNTVVEP